MLSSQQQNIILKITKRLNPTMLGVFGSYARSEETKNSDIDLLIDSKTQYNLLDLIGVEQELTEKLGVKVDLITLRSINASLKSYIEADLIRFV